MIISMTGFATQTFPFTIKGQTVSLTITLKSVNGRFFEATFKMPYPLSQLEAVCTQHLKNALIRGTIHCTFHCSNLSALKGTVHPARTLIKSYIDSCNTIQKEFNVTGTLTLNDLIELPGIFETGEESIEAETITHIMSAFDELIQSLVRERINEGTAIEQDFHARIHVIARELKKIKPRAEHIIQERKNRLMNNIEPILSSIQSEQKDMHLLNVSHQLDKMDIHEELSRFSTHLNNLEHIIEKSDVEKGKKIDFILQELFREINTLAAKCADSEISSYAINVKVELEKLRELAQNIV